MFNNKGQSLVLFVLMIPVFLLLLVLVVDIGKLVLLKQELDDINYIALDYGVDNLDNELLDDKIREIVDKNKKDINSVEISIIEEKICIKLTDSVDIIFSLVDNVDLFNISSSYCGYKKDDKIMIERDK